MYNTLFICTSKNVLLIHGILLSVFLQPYTLLLPLEYPVAVWSVISKDYLSSQHQAAYILLTADKSLNWNQMRCGKSYKIQRCLLCCSGCREEGKLLLNFKYFIQAVKFWWATQKVSVAPWFSAICLWAFRNLVWTWDHMASLPSSRTTGLRYWTMSLEYPLRMWQVKQAGHWGSSLRNIQRIWGNTSC